MHLSTAYTYTCAIWSPSMGTITDLTTVTEADLLTFEAEDAVVEDLAPTVIVRYRQNQASGLYASATSATTTEASARLNVTRTTSVETLLYDQADAITLANRLQYIASHPTHRYRVTAPPILMTQTAWDKIRVQRSRGPSLTPESFDVVLEAVSLNKSLGDVLLSGIYGDQRGVGNASRVVGADTVPAWDSANRNQQLGIAFVQDDTTERASASDPTSRRAGIVW